MNINNSSSLLVQMYVQSTVLLSTFPSTVKIDSTLVVSTNFNSYFTVFTIVTNALMAVMATSLNMLIIATFAKNYSLRQTSSNVLIIGLAISDFGVGVLCQPLFCVYHYGILKEDNSILFPAEISYAVVSLLLNLASFCCLTAITVDRFLAVHLHLRYQELVTTKRYFITLACIWVACLLWCVLIFSFRNLGLSITLLSIMFGMIALDASLIIKISQVIRRHSIQIQDQQHVLQQPVIDMPTYKKSINTMYCIMGAFLICFMPYIGISYCIVISDDVGNEAWANYIQNLTATLFMANSIVNPIIYCWRIEEMRNAAKRLIQAIYRQEEN